MDLTKAVGAVFGKEQRSYVEPSAMGACELQAYPLSQARGYDFGIAAMFCPEHCNTNILLGASLEGAPAGIIRSLKLLEARRQTLAKLGVATEQFPTMDLLCLTKTYRGTIQTATQQDLEDLLHDLDTLGQLRTTINTNYSTN